MERLLQIVRKYSSLLDTKSSGHLESRTCHHKFPENSMKLQNINLFLNHSKGSMKSDKININCGIFQGDSLSPLLFCSSLMPLTNELNNTKYGYEIYQKTINHLFYMDNLKFYAKNDKELEGLHSTLRQFINDIGMKFGLEKCDLKMVNLGAHLL